MMVLSDLFGWPCAISQNPQSCFGSSYNNVVNVWRSEQSAIQDQNQNCVGYSPMGQDQLAAYLGSRLAAAPAKPKDCEGCGAPLKTYIHHCEYCRRAA